MFLKTNIYSVAQQPRAAFVTALKYGDVSAMRRWARPLLDSVVTGIPRPNLPDDNDVERWISRTQVFIKWGRDHGY